MKKCFVLLVVFVFMLPLLALSQVWHQANQKIVGWDAVTTLDDGLPIPAGETIRYQVYIARKDGSKDNKVNMGNTTEPQFLITFTMEGEWFIGIETERLNSSGELVAKSSVAWSDNPTYCLNGETFGVVYIILPSCISNMRTQ